MSYAHVPDKEGDLEGQLNELPDDKPLIQSFDSEEDSDIRNTNESASYVQLAYIITKRAVPVCFGYIFMFLNGFINISFAGHLSNSHENASSVFAGVSLAGMYTNVSFLSLILGMSSAIDTLASQHYGAENFNEVGIVLQRSCLISLTLAIPLSLFWIYAKDIFTVLGVEADVVTVLHNYLMIRLFSVPFDILSVSYEKYLSAIGVVRPPMYANISQNIALIVFNYIFLHVLKYRYVFLAWSWVLASMCACIVMVVTSYYHPSVQKTLQPFNMKAWSDWYTFISLGLPATIMLCSEWWAFEILTLLASMLGTYEVAAQTLILQTAGLAYMFPLGLAVSTSSLVGNFIGANKVQVAIKVGKCAIVYDIICQSIIGVLLYFGGHLIISAGTDDPKIRYICNLIVPFLSCFAMIDGLVAMGSGILRGAGKQRIGAITNVLSFYGIGIPMAYYLCFHTIFEVRGLMMGLSFGTACQVVILLTMILYFEKYIYNTQLIDKVDDEQTLSTRNILHDNLENTDNNSDMNAQQKVLNRFQIQSDTNKGEYDDEDNHTDEATSSSEDDDDDDDEKSVILPHKMKSTQVKHTYERVPKDTTTTTNYMNNMNNYNSSSSSSNNNNNNNNYSNNVYDSITSIISTVKQKLFTTTTTTHSLSLNTLSNDNTNTTTTTHSILMTSSSKDYEQLPLAADLT